MCLWRFYLGLVMIYLNADQVNLSLLFPRNSNQDKANLSQENFIKNSQDLYKKYLDKDELNPKNYLRMVSNVSGNQEPSGMIFHRTLQKIREPSVKDDRGLLIDCRIKAMPQFREPSLDQDDFIKMSHFAPLDNVKAKYFPASKRRRNDIQLKETINFDDKSKQYSDLFKFKRDLEEKPQMSKFELMKLLVAAYPYKLRLIGEGMLKKYKDKFDIGSDEIKDKYNLSSDNLKDINLISKHKFNPKSDSMKEIFDKINSNRNFHRDFDLKSDNYDLYKPNNRHFTDYDTDLYNLLCDISNFSPDKSKLDFYDLRSDKNKFDLKDKHDLLPDKFNTDNINEFIKANNSSDILNFINENNVLTKIKNFRSEHNLLDPLSKYFEFHSDQINNKGTDAALNETTASKEINRTSTRAKLNKSKITWSDLIDNINNLNQNLDNELLDSNYHFKVFKSVIDDFKHKENNKGIEKFSKNQEITKDGDDKIKSDVKALKDINNSTKMRIKVKSGPINLNLQMSKFDKSNIKVNLSDSLKTNVSKYDTLANNTVFLDTSLLDKAFSNSKNFTKEDWAVLNKISPLCLLHADINATAANNTKLKQKYKLGSMHIDILNKPMLEFNQLNISSQAKNMANNDLTQSTVENEDSTSSTTYMDGK